MSMPTIDHVLIFAGTAAQANHYAIEKGWFPPEWEYIREPRQVLGQRGFAFALVGYWYHHPNSEETLELLYQRGIKL